MRREGDRIVWRDTEAAELILRHPRIFQCIGVPPCGITPAQLQAAVSMADESGRVAALVCDGCSPSEKYVIVRVLDLPLLAAAVYEVLSRARGKTDE